MHIVSIMTMWPQTTMHAAKYGPSVVLPMQ